MGINLNHFIPDYLKIQEEMERLNRMVKPSYLSVYEQMERALEPIRQYHHAFSRAAELAMIPSPYLSEIAQANQRWQDLIEQTTASSKILADLANPHQTWLNKINPLQDSMAQLQAEATMSLSNIAYRMTETERLFAKIDIDAIRSVIALPEPTILKLEDVIGTAASSYEKLAASIGTLQDLTQLPSYVLPGATREIFLSSYVRDAIYTPDKPDRDTDDASEFHLIAEVKQETSYCLGLLQGVDPAFAKLYIGAHDALNGKSVDRARHVLSSLRELWQHLLRKLAPDEHVLSWAPSDDKELNRDGRPTRKARVLYICRNLNHDPLNDFIVADTRALVKFVDFFNRVHELDTGLTDKQLRTLLLRTDSWLTYILQIWKETR